ncbi:MAG: SDR family NAD(P)-dependent oxidoreductase [Lachnospiraceae bacterium]|nr:SDR family NAD(P)-dependent oxidoreductase [Lachnospiraceae bacterium]
MEQKKVWISGASRGIGKAIAIEFAKAGYALYLNCREQKTLLEEFKLQLETEYRVPVEIFVADLGNYTQVETIFSSLPPMDVIVNNAGISYIGLFHEMTPEAWKQILDTNLSSCFYVSQLGVQKMLPNKSGRIINISSIWGNVGASMEVAYSTTKGGINAFTKALAKELAPSHISVNAIACGVIDTQMNHCFSEEEMEAIIADIPADRLGKPEEVGRLALQLANAPEYLTGQIITLDGGYI